ncbi:MAG: hypothetical protein RLZ69_1079 [Actinomycetota bacterium]
MTREASGTSWQPDSTPMEGLDWEIGDWSMMAHGNINLNFTDQGGKRGDSKTFSTSHFMLQGARQFDSGILNLKSTFSLDPLMGKSGYPLLFQTGETADGKNKYHQVFEDNLSNSSCAFSPPTLFTIDLNLS